MVATAGAMYPSPSMLSSIKVLAPQPFITITTSTNTRSRDFRLRHLRLLVELGDTLIHFGRYTVRYRQDLAIAHS